MHFTQLQDVYPDGASNGEIFGYLFDDDGNPAGAMVPSGMQVTSGALTTTSVTASTGDITATAGDIVATAGNVEITAGDLIVTTPTTPASASATGTVGTIAWDADYLYVCTATNTWERVAIATW